MNDFKYNNVIDLSGLRKKKRIFILIFCKNIIITILFKIQTKIIVNYKSFGRKFFFIKKYQHLYTLDFVISRKNGRISAKLN